jgi:hypothetical protein
VETELARALQVTHEIPVFALLVCRLPDAQQERRVDGNERRRAGAIDQSPGLNCRRGVLASADDCVVVERAVAVARVAVADSDRDRDLVGAAHEPGVFSSSVVPVLPAT